MTLSDWLTDMVRSPPPTLSSELRFQAQSFFLRIQNHTILETDL